MPTYTVLTELTFPGCEESTIHLSPSDKTAATPTATPTATPGGDAGGDAGGGDGGGEGGESGGGGGGGEVAR